MWRKLNNLLLSLRTYRDLSPDLQVRQQVNRKLQNRPALALEEWYEYRWQSRGLSQAIAAFVYTHLEKYSGLQVARLLPSDRLEEDLHLTLICWFNWHEVLSEDFWQCFGVDISDRLLDEDFITLEDFGLFLESQLLSTSRS